MSESKSTFQPEQYVMIELSNGMQIWGIMLGFLEQTDTTFKRYVIEKPVVAMFSINQQGNYKFDFFPYMISKKGEIVEINFNHIIAMSYLDDSCIKGDGSSFVNEYKECVRRYYDGSKLEIPSQNDQRIILNENN